MKTRILFIFIIGLTLSVLLSFSPTIVALADTNHCGDIVSDETWNNSGNVHIITCNVVVGDNVTLTIEEGVIVKFNLGYSLLVTGNNSAMRVLGTEANPVYFTSIRDDTVGGDTNGDGSATTPAPGDWRRIEFGENSNDEYSLVDYAVIRFGGRDDYYHSNDRGG
jgi:hypothetical protein